MSPTHLIIDALQSILSSPELDTQLRHRLDLLKSSLATLVAEFEQLKIENAGLSQRLQQLRHQSNKLDELSKKVLLWLSKRESETPTAIAFGINVDKNRAQASLNELLRISYVQRLPDVEIWKLTDLGIEVANTLNGETA
ncbi:MAG: hypothetical protein U0930_07480 [Pirellulales bacterium]